MAAAASKKESVTLSLFVGVNNLEVENVHDGHAGFGGRKLDGKMGKNRRILQLCIVFLMRRISPCYYLEMRRWRY